MNEVNNNRMGQEEQELDLKDLFWRILLNWRIIFVWAIAFSVLAGAAGFVMDVFDYNGKNEIREKKLSYKGQEMDFLEVSDELTAAEIRNVKNIVELYRNLEEKRAYNERDIFTKLDGYHLHQLYLQFYIQVSDEALSKNKETAADMNFQRQMIADDLISAYRRAFANDGTLELLCQASGIDIDTIQLNRLLGASKDGEGNAVVVTMNLVDGMETEAISESIKSIMSAMHDRLNAEIPHRITLSNESEYTVYSQSVIDYNNDMIKDIYNKETEITKLRDALSEDQEAYLFGLLAIDQDEAVADRAIDETGIEPHKPRVSKKFILLGFLLGAFLQCCWITVKVIFAARLLYAKKMTENYSLDLLGTIEVTQPKKKKFQKIDDFLIGKRDRHKKKRTQEEQIKSVVSRIALGCGHGQVKKLAFTGTCIDNCSAEVLNELVSQIEKRGIAVKTIQDIYYNADNLSECIEIGNVVLVEAVNRSIYQEIENEIEKADEFKINILGAVVLE